MNKLKRIGKVLIKNDEVVIKKEDINESTGGRKPLAISIKEQSRIAIGVSILKEGITFVALDLYAQLIRKQTVALVYDNSESYFKQYGQALNEFIDCLQIKKENFLGITIAIQGIVSQDGKKVIYGPILNNQGLTLEKFEKSSDLPVKMIHDSHAAGLAELNFSEDNNDAIYLSLNHNLGSAVFMAGKVFQGNNYSSTFEHMTLVENGRQCYCGKKGCFEAYCNEDALLKNHTNMTLEEFYKQLRQKDQTAMQSWNDYFHYLALAIHNLTMVLDAPVIIGGKIASLFENEDLCPAGKLEKEYRRLVAFDKTGLLAPGQSEKMTLEIALDKLTSYSEAEAAWVLEKGSYVIWTGNSLESSSSVKTYG